MRIAVVAVAAEDDALVLCHTPAGQLLVRWRGGRVPTPGASIDVELDIPGELTWGSGVELVDGEVQAASSKMLVGAIELIDGEVVTVRLGDGLIVLEVLGQPPLAAVGQLVVVRPGCVEAWPTGI